MRKLLIIMLLIPCLFGCFFNKPKVVDKCKNAPKIWWGQKGVEPTNNAVWSCYDWILISSDIENKI